MTHARQSIRQPLWLPDWALGRVLREGTASNKATAHLALRRMKVPEAKKVLEAAGKSTD